MEDVEDVLVGLTRWGGGYGYSYGYAKKKMPR